MPEPRQALVVFAPVAGDAGTLRALIESEGVQACVCADAAAFYAAADDSALALVITEEGLARCSLQDLSARLGHQPAWSDLPIVVLASDESREIDTDRYTRLAGIGNVILLTRPTTRLALTMALRSALRTRRLQFAVRDQLDELSTHAGRLESTVEERTRLLQHEVQERHRAEQSLAEARRLESLGQLTGGIAHDFNNILQVVAGSEILLRMLLAKTDDPRVTRALDAIRRSAGHGASLTQQLLAYARRQPLASVAIDMRIHLRATSEMILRTLGPDVRFHMELASSLWAVLADPAQLDAALLNIAGNARDAMPDGGALTLQVRNWVLPDPALPQGDRLSGDFVGVFMTDEGEGMSEATAQQAFEPFFTTKPIGKGTGLGLSQVYGFAIQSHGLAFIRHEAVGTTIGILLPRSREQAQAAPVDPSTLRAGGLAGLRVLYVEDDPAVADATVGLLQSLKAGVRVVDSADAAIREDLRDIDLVFSDVMMPGTMDGIDLARWLAERHPALPVVLTSGYMLSPERLQALDVQFVRKPFTAGDLNDAFVKALRKNDAGSPRQRR
ncbi:response regulator [Herbaspirillum sp. SJZ107]|uniref:response regulator n=1 Tax=Herbaspirillum sp. SJZ107 TaxID=2572881 RepID=UPI00116B3DBB|nr:response regulator [Herbaspirillum sp. SJZ107]TQK07317.1 histidine kinase/DNA gyrase B/HSP90-like ATPase [Herbaspirillum sp. SJZ107]